MSTRDKIVGIIKAKFALPFWENKAADAILAALPDMIAPLVWEVKGNYGTNDYVSHPYLITQGCNPHSGSTRCFVCVEQPDGSSGIGLVRKEVTNNWFDNPDEAKAAVDTHYRSEFKKTLIGETTA
jgi:hypothetical protein